VDPDLRYGDLPLRAVVTLDDQVDPVWQRVIDEAWRSYAAGGWGIGAVALSGDGTTMAAAGNRSKTRADEDPFAHAETLALMRLPPDHRLTCTIITSLEPCVLCLGALTYFRLPEVIFGARDLSFSAAHRALKRVPIVRSRVPDYVGPRLDGIGVFCRLVALVSEMESGLGRGLFGLERRMTPLMLGTAEQLVTIGAFRAYRNERRGWLGALDQVNEPIERLVAELRDLEAQLSRLKLI
jgi:tRNA(Arg) A34 adenosine deaminase TadA